MDPLSEFLSQCPEMLFVLEGGGAILHLSGTLQGFLGAEARGGAAFSAHVHQDDRGAFEQHIGPSAARAEQVEVSLRLRDASGAYHLFDLRARRSTSDGKLHGSLRESTAAANARAAELERAARLFRVLLDSLPITVWAINQQGLFTFEDGRGAPLVERAPGQSIGANILEAYAGSSELEHVHRALAGEPRRSLTEVHGVAWENFYLPAQGKVADDVAVVGVTLDASEAKRIEQELRTRLALVERQQEVIRALSTPIIEVWDKVLTLPMLGVVDSSRASDVMESLLSQVSRKGARFAILDLTGVDALDTGTAGHLLKLIQAIRLLGAEGIITGIQPNVAQTMVALGVDLEGITTLAKLRDGLRLCIKRMREAPT